MKNKEIEISKFLSMVLRHHPGTIGIKLDTHGWIDVNTLLEKLNNHGKTIDRTMLERIVETNSKKRFAFNETGDKIRASQGHSIDIELGYNNRKPPEILFHGTGAQSVQSIWETGIEKRNRQFVHLSSNIETAINVGQRHGKPYIFKVLAEQMYIDKFEFFLSANGVWLTAYVPVKYLTKMDD